MRRDGLRQHSMTNDDGTIGRWVSGSRLLPSIRDELVVQMVRAVAALDEAGTPPELAIHTTRKAIKRSRGLLRLLRGVLVPEAYRRENRALRDAGRRLGSLRDAVVVVDTLDLYAMELEAAVGSAVLTRIRSCLVAAFESHDDVTASRSNVAGVLGDARVRYAALTVGAVDEGFSPVSTGLRRGYRNGRKAMRVASASGRVGDFHEWRKSVKYLRYQLEHLCLIEPDMISGRIAQLDRLGELLGDAHDLWLFAGSIERCCSQPEQRTAVVNMVHTKRHTLESTALTVGGPLYADGPTAFADELGSYWQAVTSK